jgi:D-3-phosphoglycerate dehydrogenase
MHNTGIMTKKILCIDTPHPDLEKGLGDMGFTCIKQDISYDELKETAHAYTGYIIRSKFSIDKGLIDRSTSLRFIARIGAGMENIDTVYAQSKGIQCLNSPEGNADAVGEYVIAATLNMLRRLATADSEVKNGLWDRDGNRGSELHTKTFGIIGYGHMGKAVAKKLSGFGCHIIAYDKYKSGFGNELVRETSLEDMLIQADIVSIHINYIPENLYFINKNLLNAFRKNIYLINTSRGKVLHTGDLVQCIQSGKVMKATLDVLEYEDIRLRNRPKEAWDENMHFLAQSNKVFLSPHIAGQTHESGAKHARVLLEKIKSLYQ